MTLEEITRKTHKKVILDREDEYIPAFYECLADFDTWKDIVKFHLEGDIGLTLNSPIEDFVEILEEHTEVVNSKYEEQFLALPPETKDENGRPVEAKIIAAHQIAVMSRLEDLPSVFTEVFADYFNFRELVVDYITDEDRPEIHIKTPISKFVQYFVDEVGNAAEHFSFMEELMEAGVKIIKFE